MSFHAVPQAHPSNLVQLADWAEIECLYRKDGTVSTLDIYRVISRGDDGRDTLDETEDTSDVRYEVVSTALSDIEARAKHCGGGYPYALSTDGGVVSFVDSEKSWDATSVYLFMLLATRMNMKTDKVQNGEDATKLFEHLCKEASVRYWGGPDDTVHALVFGTGRYTEDKEDGDAITSHVSLRSFKAKVDDLCHQIGEGAGYARRGPDTVTAKDGKLDVVVWRRFSDRREGQLIGFGQCKTGKHWQNDLAKLRPEDFFKKWTSKGPAVDPVRLYFVCDRVVDRWYDHAVDGGILFDRCRIFQHAKTLPSDLLKSIKTWVGGAMTTKGLALP